jgi:hypothetical protein
MPKGVYDRKPLEERVLALISKDETTGCWVFQGHIDKDGYGQISVNCKTVHVHRAMYIAKNGAIPAGYVAGHLCDEKYPADCKLYRKCCNPDHITPMTTKENIQRAVNLGRYVVTSGAFKKGENCGDSNLNAKNCLEDILEIRTLQMNGYTRCDKDKFKKFNIKPEALDAILYARNWTKPEHFPPRYFEKYPDHPCKPN